MIDTHPDERGATINRTEQMKLGEGSNDKLRALIEHIKRENSRSPDPDVQELINMAADLVKLEQKWKQINYDAAQKEYKALEDRLTKLKGHNDLPTLDELQTRLLALKFPTVPTTIGVGGGASGGI